jgi:hypothetical protein
MKEHRKKEAGIKATWILGALGIVVAYFGMFGLLMFPVVRAAGYV